MFNWILLAIVGIPYFAAVIYGAAVLTRDIFQANKAIGAIFAIWLIALAVLVIRMMPGVLE